jgi:phosphopantothenoylcysteine decarboxylase/phosphopantothenate--cysteine ligase
VGELLIGEDLCAAPWYHDLAWIAGELVELRWLNDGDPQEWQRLLDALFEGYGRDLGEDANRLIALRIALHLHDISAYVGLDAALLATYAGFLDFLVNLDGGSPHARTS